MGKRKWWLFAALAWMAAIFFFTQLPYFTGENTTKFIEKVVETDQNEGHTPSVSSMLNIIVRKVTHVMVFGILALLLFKWFEPYRYSYVLSWCLTFLYALSDEWHQSFITGRVASFKDVLFDSLGAFLVLVWVFVLIRKKKSAS